MKSFVTMAVTVLAVLLLSSGGLLVTHAATPNSGSDWGQRSSNSQALSLTMGGGVVSAGNQRYLIVQNGPALLAVINGDPLATSQLTYTLRAQQNGLSTSGSATFTLTGVDAITGASVALSGNVQISGAIPAVCLPSYSMTGVCASSDSSEVPAAFTGLATIQTGSATTSSNNDNDNSQSSTSSTAPSTTVGMVMESAYFNPFGNAITITSSDSSIVIVTNYTQATIDWTSVVDAGAIGGTLGTTPITGAFQQVAAEHENLVAGTAIDFGTLSLSGVTNMTSGNPISYMNANGGYVGSSTIPQAGSFSCGTVSGINVCAETGFQDNGSFLLFGHGALIRGSYSTTWSIPAFGFSSVVTGKVTTGSS